MFIENDQRFGAVMMHHVDGLSLDTLLMLNMETSSIHNRTDHFVIENVVVVVVKIPLKSEVTHFSYQTGLFLCLFIGPDYLENSRWIIKIVSGQSLSQE
jgi:hypothetical protein